MPKRSTISFVTAAGPESAAFVADVERAAHSVGLYLERTTAPLGITPKKGTESKPRNKKNDLRQLMGSDIFADRLMCHFP